MTDDHVSDPHSTRELTDLLLATNTIEAYLQQVVEPAAARVHSEDNRYLLRTDRKGGPDTGSQSIPAAHAEVLKMAAMVLTQLCSEHQNGFGDEHTAR